MWTLIIIVVVVVVVVDDDTYYWVYLSSNHLFQVYYKVRQLLLQSATAFFITNCDGLLSQSATAFLLQSATGITKCDNFITKCDRYYKVRRLLQSATVQKYKSIRSCKGKFINWKFKGNVNDKNSNNDNGMKYLL